MMWMSTRCGDLSRNLYSQIWIACAQRNYTKRRCSVHSESLCIIQASTDEHSSPGSHISFMSNRFECYTWNDSSSHSARECNRVDAPEHSSMRLYHFRSEPRGNQLYFSTTFHTFLIHKRHDLMISEDSRWAFAEKSSARGSFTLDLRASSCGSKIYVNEDLEEVWSENCDD